MTPRRIVLGLVATLFATTAPIAARTWADEISVTQWGQSLYGAPYAVAMSKGLFKQAGVDITGIIGSGGGGTTVRNLFASPTPYGEVAVAAALAAAKQGLDVVIVNTGTRSVAEASVVVMPNSDVKTLAELATKKIALTSPRGVSEMLYLMALKAEGIDASTAQKTFSGGYGPSLTLLEQGAVQGAALIEPLSIIRHDRYRTLVAYKDVLPPMTTSVGITSRAWATANPEKLRAIIAGRRAGVRALYADPEGAAKILEEPFNLQPDIARIAVHNMIAPRMWSEGDLVQTELDRMADGLRLIGELKGPVDWSTLIDRSYLPADLQAAK